MLSVILYGRNDSHGYNLHKRAAISLNAIAELLSDPDDEILFVDYNTPSDLPTFVEAISDTLTEKAIARLKVLRVRPDVHRDRFAPRTHLLALEPIARNVAIRRSNPANKWILSTNTDMIFCPREAGADLTSITRGLADGFYHLPRFELPEGLWETLDRKDAPRLIEAARDWGKRFHLNEIVLADRDNVYDAPGDFQLFLRQDLFDIDGFHEEMILGWHLDANMAKRMRLLRGKVSSALDHLVGYHCDHTRMSSPYHRGDRTENDQVRFDDMVTTPQVPEQRNTWGLPDVAVESFRLGEASGARYFRGLQSTIPEPLEGFLQTQYLLTDFGRLEYPADHVLPYLLDLVAAMPMDTRIGYVGVRADTWDMFASGWGAMGGAPIRLLDDCDWLDAGSHTVRRLPLEAWLGQCDMFIFEIGGQESTHHTNLTAADSARLWVVDKAFKSTIVRDQARLASGLQTRRVVVINGVHNFFEPEVMPHVAVTLTPYSSRIRHGFVSDRTGARIANAGPARRAVMDNLGMREPPAKSDVQHLAGLTAKLKTAGPGDAIWAQAAPLAAELSVSMAVGMVDAGPLWTEIADRLQVHRPSSPEQQEIVIKAALMDQDNTRKHLGLTLTPTEEAFDRLLPIAPLLSAAAGLDAPSRLVRMEDWDDPAWADVARLLFSNREHARLLERDEWTWERVSLARNLMTALPPTAELNLERPTVLVVGKEPEILAFALAHQGYDVDIADPRTLATGDKTSVDWRPQFDFHGWVMPRPVGLIEDRAAQFKEGFLYDAVLVLQNGVFVTQRLGMPKVLQGAMDLLRPGGHFGFTALGRLFHRTEGNTEYALPPSLVADGAFGIALSNLTGLELIGRIDGRMTPRTYDRSGGDGALALTHEPYPETLAVGVYAMTKTERPSDWDTLRHILETGVYNVGADVQVKYTVLEASGLLTAEDLLQAPLTSGPVGLGAKFDALEPRLGLRKTPLGMHAPASVGAKVIAVIPLGDMETGNFELDIEVNVTALESEGVVLVAGVVSDGRLVAEHLLTVSDPGADRLVGPIDVPGQGWPSVSVLLKAQGRADMDILTFALR
jgi:hypothetical protein